MVFDIVLVDRESRSLESARHIFKEPVVDFRVGNVESIPAKGCALVSPANSLCFMDGGIDLAYSRVLFPGIERHIRQVKLPRLGLQTLLGRNYLPVGSATVTPWGEDCCLITAPTMFLPHDVSMTRNAYHSFMAALCAFDKWKRMTGSDINRIVCPLLCTGWGRMPADQAALQMYEAFVHFNTGVRPAEVMRFDDPEWFITDSKDEEQPDVFDNREIKVIPADKLVYVN